MAMRHQGRFLTITASLLAVFFVSLLVGRYTVDIQDMFASGLGTEILTNIRLPRMLAAALLGMALSAAGAALQSAFKNPLVEPSLLGVSQGSAFGAALAILFLVNSPVVVEISSTAFGLLALLAAYSLSSSIKYGGKILRLVLAGIAVSAMFSGGVGVIKTMADPLNQLPALTFWLLGGLSGVSWADLFYMLPLTLAGIAVLLILRWRINLLTLRDDVTFSLGADPGKLRAVVVIFAVLAVAAVTSVAGVIAWIGLIVPHLARKIFGADNSRIIPASLILGATLMIVFDTVARTLTAGEIPLGIMTSLCGAPIFLLLLSRGGES
ncbi:MAG: FecCD family ABC transporter permease [Candidatus Hadarchaeum sp.]|uniref:FecCD family ABC transporter permease n=1 Tax=Candidatus Hadarchaeum sp. TaxID=2883567 RepID=UPI003D0B823E